MSPDSSNVLYILLWVLAPIVPAFVLFKFLKNAGQVSGRGPSSGFSWSMKGAFAGYGFVFLALSPVIYKAITPPPPPQEWKTVTVEGVLKVVGKNPDPRLARFRIHPPSPDLDETSGHFILTLQMPANPDPSFSPYLDVEGDRLQPVSIPLLDTNKAYQQVDFKIERQADGRKIKINEPIVLNEVTAAPADPHP